MPSAVISAILREINGYPKFNKNKLHNVSMGTKNIFNVKHDFVKQTLKLKRMLLVGVHLHEKRGNYVSLTFIKKTKFLRIRVKEIHLFSITLYGHGTNLKVPYRLML